MAQSFDWDLAKERSNLRKHGIEFGDAVEAFADPFANFEEDRVIDDEERWHVTGMVNETLLVLVVYTLREDEDETGEEITRIISARRANRNERRRYDDNVRALFGGFA